MTIPSFSKKQLILLGTGLILILTNPSRSSFISYLHTNSTDDTGRDLNLFVASIYSDSESKYLGFLGNFIPLKSEPIKSYSPSINTDSVAADTASVVDDPFREFGGHRIK